jgi:hypothetical protein
LQTTAGQQEASTYFIGYSDDGNIGGETDAACTLLMQYQARGGDCGILPNMEKTFVMLGAKENNDEVERAIGMYQELGVSGAHILIHPANGGRKDDYGVIYLGVPIGTDEFIRLTLAAKLEGYRAEATTLMAIHDLQNK